MTPKNHGYNEIIAKIRKFSVLIILVCLLSTNWASVHAQQAETSKFFSETGHYVKGDFLTFYNSSSNATFIYGYPITEEFISKDGVRIQYFQRARFEYRAELPFGQRVQLTSLGQATFVSTGQLDINSPSACRTFSEKSPAVCFAFLEFFEKYGGTAQFGYPISGFEYHENVLVQYFEKARLEWQPGKPEGQHVVVSDLGRITFEKLNEDPGLLAPVKTDNTTQNQIKSIHVRAFVLKAATLATDSQLIYIIVQDQLLQSVADAKCTAIVHWKDGHTDSNTISTNTSGIGQMALSFSNQPYGSLIYIDATCVIKEIKGSTTTSFRIWY